MSTFILACDESWGNRSLGYFYRCGVLIPESDLRLLLEPAWRKNVLEGPPSIPFLHMRQIYNDEWSSSHGLNRVAANNRVAAGVSVISTIPSVFALGGRIPGTYAKEKFKDLKLDLGNGEICDFDPEFPLFTAFLLRALQVASQLGCTRLDTLVERNGVMTDRLALFARNGGSDYRDTDDEHLSALVGTFKLAGKEEPVLQAADLIVWLTQRAATKNVTPDQAKHIEKLAKLHGARIEFGKSDIDGMRQGARGAATSKPGTPY